MDFIKVLNLILKSFTEEDIQYALIGGFAMGSWGIMRSTVDLDFLVNSADLDKIEKIMTGYTYKNIYKTENVSQYISDLKPFGQIDFLHAFRRISLSMLKRAVERPIFNSKYNIRVVIPEDIIGLKIQAMSNDISRELLEYADIQLLMERFGEKLNWKLIGEYFKLFKKEERYEEFKKKHSKTK